MAMSKKIVKKSKYTGRPLYAPSSKQLKYLSSLSRQLNKPMPKVKYAYQADKAISILKAELNGNLRITYDPSIIHRK